MPLSVREYLNNAVEERKAMAIKRAVAQLEGLKLHYATKPRKKKQETNLAEVRMTRLGGLAMSKQVD